MAKAHESLAQIDEAGNELAQLLLRISTTTQDQVERVTQVQQAMTTLDETTQAMPR